MTKKDVLIIFLKPFVFGRVKTRLAKSIGNQAAMEVYKRLVEHTMVEADKLPKNVNIILCYSEHSEPRNLLSVANDYIIQEGDTLGDKMAFAMNWAEEQGYSRKVIVGSDCAEITGEVIKAAYRELEQKDVVLGPAKDGGYYLIGLKKPMDAIFKEINWSTDTVYNSTVQNIRDINLSFGVLALLSDIDNLVDLRTAPLFLKDILARIKA